MIVTLRRTGRQVQKGEFRGLEMLPVPQPALTADAMNRQHGSVAPASTSKAVHLQQLRWPPR